jgi:hypothetical protein
MRATYSGYLAIFLCVAISCPNTRADEVVPPSDNLLHPRLYDRPLIPDHDPPGESDSSTRDACGNIVYSDIAGTGFLNPIYNATDSIFPWEYVGDDVTLAGTDRFICEFSVRLGTTDINAVSSFPYTFEFWDVAGTNVCPDNGANMMYQSAEQIATGFPGSIISILFSTPVDPPVHVPNSFWITLRTSNHSTNQNGGIPYVRIRSGFGAPPEIGSTLSDWYGGYNNDSCDYPQHFLVYSGGAIVGFAFRLQANNGPSGSCCNQNTAVCADNVNLSNCLEFNHAWNPEPGCPQGCTICDISCIGSNVLENEPVCTANYVDTTDNGCAFSEGSASFIDVTCGADICGSCGVYSFQNGTVTQNRRDNDYYRLVLTTSTQVTWSVAGVAAMNAVIQVPRLGPGMGPCDDIDSIVPDGTPNAGSSRGCETAVATACLPPGTYYLIARPMSIFPIPCGLDYRATLTCTPCNLPTGACCLPNQCAILEDVRCQQQGGSYRSDNSLCADAALCPKNYMPENESVCGFNYTDTTNAGCSSIPVEFTEVSCGETICGTSGTYVFTNGTMQTNARDRDWYRLSLTTAKVLDLQLASVFRSEMLLLAAPNSTDPCDTLTIADQVASLSCEELSISEPLCPGTYYLVVGPAVLSGIDCGSPYVLSIACTDDHGPPCCKGDMNNDGIIDAADIQHFVRTLISPPMVSLPVTGCFNLNACRADLDDDFLLTNADIPGFVTVLLAGGTCPTLPDCADPARCHFPDQSGASISGIAMSNYYGRVADDFKVDAGGTIQSICWYGCYLNAQGTDTCASTDNFTITIYNDNSGSPASILNGPLNNLIVSRIDTGADIPFPDYVTAREFKYSATIPSTAVSANSCYWLEIVNRTSSNCLWFWSKSALANGMSASDIDGLPGTPNYAPADLFPGDFAFCLNDIHINKRDCPPPTGRCCYNNGANCQVTDIYACSAFCRAHGSLARPAQ